MAACPAGAIYKRKEDGIVMINRDECQEFKTCAVACPFSGPQFADDAQEPVWQEKWQVKHPMQKCNFCLERWSESKKPICVEGCPQRALDAGDITELIKKYPDALRTVAGFPFSDMDRTGVTLAKDTVPSILFKPKQ
jgi:anaerobic dimethyl sulfoxide reductase subunit B (iron-sulfur subunit)